MRQGIYSIIGMAIFIIACQPEEEKISRDNISLSFSSDSIVFDTIFSSIPSITRRLRIKNPNDQAVEIEQILLAGGADSPFSIVVNGKKGINFSDQLLLGGDSLLILAEADIDPGDQNLPFIVDDEILFFTNGRQQSVKLVAWGQDAYFLGKQIIRKDTTWKADKPIILLDSILLDSAFTLNIEAGTKIYANTNGTLLIGGNLLVKGTVEEPVKLTNSRLDLEDALGQWRGIFFLRTSQFNQIHNASIRNAINGIYLGTPDNDTLPDLELKNVKIENMLGNGIIAFTSDIYGENVLINNCAGGNVAFLAGGNYYFTHATWANFSRGFFRDSPLAVFSNHLEGEILHDFRLDLYNSIVYGDLDSELTFNFINGSEVVLSFANNLLKTNEQNLDINNNILNQDPLFIDPAEYNYRLDTLSPAHNQGATEYTTELDIGGNPRKDLPDLGVWERQD